MQICRVHWWSLQHIVSISATQSLPDEMNAQVLEAYNQPYTLKTLSIPEVSSPHNLLIKVDAASYCHTDAVLASGQMKPNPPSFPHVGSHGTITKEHTLRSTLRQVLTRGFCHLESLQAQSSSSQKVRRQLRSQSKSAIASASLIEVSIRVGLASNARTPAIPNAIMQGTPSSARNPSTTESANTVGSASTRWSTPGKWRLYPMRCKR